MLTRRTFAKLLASIVPAAYFASRVKAAPAPEPVREMVLPNQDSIGDLDTGKEITTMHYKEIHDGDRIICVFPHDAVIGTISQLPGVVKPVLPQYTNWPSGISTGTRIPRMKYIR